MIVLQDVAVVGENTNVWTFETGDGFCLFTVSYSI